MRSLLSDTPAMGIYQMLYAFMEASGNYMGEPGTHPWSQGYPLTSRLPGGPELPENIALTSSDLMYQKPWGHPALRERIAEYYRQFYGAKISYENVMVFSGGRGALFATLFLLAKDVRVLIEEAEYTPYYDKLRILGHTPIIIPSNEENGFLPGEADYEAANASERTLRIRSNPCNPTGQVLRGEALQRYVRACSSENRGALIDEAYEFFVSPEPVSALQYIDDIDSTNLFVAGAATKGLQAPGIRVGWLVASRKNIETLGNYSTFAMGGVSRASQLYAEALLEPKRVEQARAAVSAYYSRQRERYGEALTSMGLELFTGEGGFYHWCKLPQGLSADEFNAKLFAKQAAILPGRLCDMKRREDRSPFRSFFRFSFGPLPESSFDSDVEILRACLH